MAHTGADLWVFGYGSLMWAPGFAAAERVPVRLRGWHRRFSLTSPRSWGTPQRPGLCAALHEGGECGGFALRVEPAQVAAALGQLERREAAYRFRRVPITAPDGRRLTALTFLWDPHEPRFRPHLTIADAAAIICRAAPGRMGRSAEYLARTIEILESAGLESASERELLAATERTGRIGA